METEYTNVASELKNGNFIIISTSGVSMEPLLHDKRKKNATQVLIKPISAELETGDLPIFIIGDGKYVIHRIIKKITDENGVVRMYYTRGDNCIGHEKIPPAAILGIVAEIYRNGHTVKVTDRGYRIYVSIWNKIFPIRLIWYKVRIYIHKIAHRIRSK